MASGKKKFCIFGQDLNVLVAVFGNIVSWLVIQFFPSLLPYLLPKIEEEDTSENPSSNQTRCIAIGRPGGKEQLRLITLKPGYATCGYNVICGDDNSGPFVNVSDEDNLPPNTVVVRIHAFSINYADCCIRWGLYESANTFVGWPIVPGFDIAGTVERVSSNNDQNSSSSSSSSNFQVGDRVYGATFFGAYSTRVLVPQLQLRKIPQILSFSQAAAIPAVSITALYILYLGGQFFPPEQQQQGCSNSVSMPKKHQKKKNTPILIHSCAGGVGSMLVQMSKILALSPVVGVVGLTTKVDAAKSLGCDVVIDKSSYSKKQDWWKVAKEACCCSEGGDSGGGYKIVADPNGVSTLKESYQHLGPTGRLIVFGFHSNLPMGQDMLHPLNWVRMIIKMLRMPQFDAMDLVESNKSVLGFNLSFFVDQVDMLTCLYDQIETWFQNGHLRCPRVVEMKMEDVQDAHALIQSGKSIGKIVIQTNTTK